MVLAIAGNLTMHDLLGKIVTPEPRLAQADQKIVNL
jgi:hypothetical protein